MFKKLFLGAAVALTGLAMTGTEAKAVHGPYRAATPYYRAHGVRFTGGYYYTGKYHPHWGGRVWNARYGRYHYWDPYLRCYYYWYAPRACYLPVDVPCPF